MSKGLLLVFALALAACSASGGHELTIVHDGDPTWALNPGKWNATTNDLTSAPVNAPILASSHE